MKRFIRSLCAALVAVAVSSLVSFGSAAKADVGDDVFVTMPEGPQGFAGTPTSRVAAKRAIKASTATPIGTDTGADPITRLPGRVTIYNASSGEWVGLVRVKAWYAGAWHTQDFRVEIDAWDNVPFDLTRWNATYWVTAFVDTNENGFIDKGDQAVKRARISTSKRWAKRRGWLTRTRDLVLVGDGEPNPPTDGYLSRVKNTGDFVYWNVGVPYGQPVTLEIKLVALTDTAQNPTVTDTITRTFTAPASATAASVFVLTSGGMATAPAGHVNGEFGFVLDITGKQVFSVTANGTPTTGLWYKP